MPHHSIPSDDADQMRLNAELARSRSAETHSLAMGRTGRERRSSSSGVSGQVSAGI